MKDIKVLLDNSAIKESFFTKLEQNNILDLVEHSIISFFLPDVVFFENFIPLKNKDYKKFSLLLDFSFKYCNQVFLPLRKIIEQEIHNDKGKGIKYFYSKSVIDEFKNDYKNNNVFWDIKKYNKDKINNQEIFSSINNYIDKHLNLIANVKSNSDLKNYIAYCVQQYSYANLNTEIIYKVLKKGNTPKENAKSVYEFISAYFLSKVMIYNFSTSYEQINKLFKKDNYFWIFYNTYFCTLISRVSYPDFHKDSTYFDNDYISYMKDMDILVSDDCRYMKDCFCCVYKSSSKKIMTTNDFISYINENYKKFKM